MNDTQKEILERLNNGEATIYYHPQSLLGGEAVAMRDAGLIELHTDQRGMPYITLPGWQQCTTQPAG